jgi:hypothetical protein
MGGFMKEVDDEFKKLLYDVQIVIGQKTTVCPGFGKIVLIKIKKTQV